MFPFTSPYSYACIYAHVYACIYAHLSNMFHVLLALRLMHTHACACICAHLYAYACIYMHKHAYRYACTSIHLMHMHAYRYTHTFIPPPSSIQHARELVPAAARHAARVVASYYHAHMHMHPSPVELAGEFVGALKARMAARDVAGGVASD